MTEPFGGRPAWPSQLAYQDALASGPAVAFADPDLAAGAFADVGPWGAPSPIAGQFANVYRVRTQGGEWAARVFLRDLPDRATRYTALQNHLAILAAPPPCLLPFTYQARGVDVAGRWFPLVKMRWASGRLLNNYIEANLHDSDALFRLAQSWRVVSESLASAQIAHGDLQHGNILVEANGALRLLDYDGVFAPPLAGGTGAETGHPAYQHPARRARDFGLHMDRFSILVIYTALVCLAHAPELWYRLDTGDNLLFRPSDFADPQNSRAFALLGRLHSPAPARAVALLRAAARAPLSQTPLLERLAEEHLC